MPRELPELVGQPLGWDMLKVTQQDGSETLIERAVSIGDICPRLGENTPGHEQAVLCFFTDQKHGPCVAFLVILDIEKQLLSEKVRLTMTTILSIRERSVLGENFLNVIEDVYGAEKSEVARVVLS